MFRFAALVALAVVIGAAVLSAQQNTGRVAFEVSDAVNASIGTAVLGVGDRDGDGRSEVLAIGANDLRLFGGTGALLATVGGLGPSNFGLTRSGDLNGDGADDFLASFTTVAGPVVLALSGLELSSLALGGAGTALVLYTVPAPASAGPSFGWSIAGLDDMNADGMPDFAVGAPESAANGAFTGAVYVFSGADGASLTTIDGTASSCYLGQCLAVVGDVDLDGTGDVLVGAPHSGPNAAGRVDLLSGAAIRAAVLGQTPVPPLVIASFVSGAVVDEDFGVALAALGDLDDDGIAEFAVGAPSAGTVAGTAAGKIFVFKSNGALKFTIAGTLSFEGIGAALADAGDVNGDGVNDLVTGAPKSTNTIVPGSVRVYSGMTAGLLVTQFAPPSIGEFGYAVAGAGDVNGDGFADVVVGAPAGLAPLPGITASMVRVFSAAAVLPSIGSVPPSSLLLAWSPGQGLAGRGALIASGAVPFGPGVLGASFVAANSTILGVPIYIGLGPNPPALLLNFGYDATGRKGFPLTVNQPALAGATLYVQVFMTGTSLASSNAIEILFAN